jgi:predicted GNAT family acetyltransferase
MNVRDNKARRRFEVLLDDGDFAFAEYSIDDGAIAFPHTVVPRKNEGQGIGSALAKAALDSAREHGLKVRPQCSFFASYMIRHPETQDLLAPGEGAALARYKPD